MVRSPTVPKEIAAGQINGEEWIAMKYELIISTGFTQNDLLAMRLSGELNIIFMFLK